MKRVHRTSKLFFLVLCVCWLSLTGRQAAQTMSVAPANPTISVGQTQQFTASGSSTPTAVSAGGEYTCVRLPNGRVQCTGRNQFGQLGDGQLDRYLGARPGERHDHGDARRRRSRVRVRAAVERHGEVLGTRRVRTARRRHLWHRRARARRGERPQRRGRTRGWLWTRLCAALERDDALLGRERRRAARQRHHGQPRHGAAGDRQRHQRRHRADHRRAITRARCSGTARCGAGGATRDNWATAPTRARRRRWPSPV